MVRSVAGGSALSESGAEPRIHLRIDADARASSLGRIESSSNETDELRTENDRFRLKCRWENPFGTPCTLAVPAKELL